MTSSTTKKMETIAINTEWCKRCGICVAFCPKTVFDADADGAVIVARLEDCIDCELCERMCPDLAITLVRKPSASKEST